MNITEMRRNYMYGGVPTQEITELIAKIETELSSIEIADIYDIGKRDGLVFTLKSLMVMIYEEDYCKKYFEKMGY